MIHPNTEIRFISPEIGFGVVATQFIPKGTITWVLDALDQEFTPEHVKKMHPMMQEMVDKYTYRNHVGNHILCWDHGRYVNHSFNSNCITTPYDFEIAVRDIQAGEELTDDYGYLNITEPFDALPEKGSDRTRVYPDDLVQFHPLWDKKLQEAIVFTHQVKQDLKPLLTTNTWEKVVRIASGQEKMDSILNCYYRETLGVRS